MRHIEPVFTRVVLRATLSLQALLHSSGPGPTHFGLYKKNEPYDLAIARWRPRFMVILNVARVLFYFYWPVFLAVRFSFDPLVAVAVFVFSISRGESGESLTMEEVRTILMNDD